MNTLEVPKKKLNFYHAMNKKHMIEDAKILARLYEIKCAIDEKKKTMVNTKNYMLQGDIDLLYTDYDMLLMIHGKDAKSKAKMREFDDLCKSYNKVK